MTYSLSTSSVSNRSGVDGRLIEVSDLAIALTRVDFGHGPDSGLRTAEDQARLHAGGVSPNCDGYITKSNHQTGRALDFYAYVDGAASWHHPHLAMVAAAFLQAASILGYKVRWGGLWKSKNPTEVDGVRYGWDCPHIELMED